MKADLNKIAGMCTIIILVLISAIYGYRLEISTNGLTFENKTIVKNNLNKMDGK